MPKRDDQRKTNLADYIPPAGSPGLLARNKWSGGSGSFIAWDSSSPGFTPQQPVDADPSALPNPGYAEECVVSARDPADAVAALTDSNEEAIPACGPAKEDVVLGPSAVAAAITKRQDQEALMANAASIPADSGEGIHHPPRSEIIPWPEEKDLDEITKSNRNVQGLLHFKKWWYLRRIDVSVKGKLLTGIPIFVRKNAIRVVNDAYSYIIPLHNVDFIRTPDGFRSIESEFEGNVIEEQSV